MPQIYFAWLLGSFVFFFNGAFAQKFGGTPSYQKWEQIKLKSGNILFPKNIDSIGQKVASIVEKLQHDSLQPIQIHPRTFNIALRVNGMQSNGYVQLGPFRSEFFLSPPQNPFQLGAQEWISTLSLHEFRHVEQYNAFNIGLSHTMGILFGQDGQALANAAAIPDWYFEGDAVYNETLLSKQGRGKLPAFFNGHRSLFYGKKQYNYQQLRNGSYQHFIPDHYQLGYLLTGYGAEKYGKDFWQNVTQDAASFKPLIFPLQGAIKKYSGRKFRDFVADAFRYYHSQWINEVEEEEIKWITEIKDNNVINYKYPYLDEEGNLIVLKSSKNEIPAFFKINSKEKEEKIAIKHISVEDYYSYKNGKIIYAAFQPNQRWGFAFSRLVVVDINTGEEQVIAPKMKYVSPDISKDGSKIIAVSNTHGKPFELVLLDNKGAEVKKLQTKTDGVFYFPKFLPDDSSVYYVESKMDGQMRLGKQNIYSGAIEILLPYSNRIIGFPVVSKDMLIYSCSNNGRDEIWAYAEKLKKTFRMASHTTGLYQALLDSNKLIFSAFTADGYRIGTTKPLWEPQKPVELQPLYLKNIFPENSFDFLEDLKLKNYTISRFSKVAHPFNFHSWYPVFNAPEYSFNIYGNNVINNIETKISYTFNENEKYHKVGVSSIFGGSYVMPFIEINQTWNRTAKSEVESFYFNEFSGIAGLTLPLNFTRGKQYRFFNLSTSYHLAKQDWTGEAKGKLEDKFNSYVDNRLFYTSHIQLAEQHILPHWGQTLQLQLRNLISKGSGFQFLGKAGIFLPGLLKSHSIALSGAIQFRDTFNHYQFSNDFPFSRGYFAVNYPMMWKASVNYHLPIFYPDWGFGNIVFFKRIRANMFYDYTQVKSRRTGQHLNFPAAGAELYFDTRWWNQYPLSIGIRYSRLLNENIQALNPNQWELILPVSILN